MENEILLKELEKKFDLLKKELGFRYNLDDIDSIFFIKDYILSVKFISSSLSRQICLRIIDTYTSWISYMHTIIFPQTYDIINLTESGFFNEKEKKEISKMISKVIVLVRTNSIAGLTKDKKIEAWFIDEAVDFWRKEFYSFLIKIIKKVNEGWKNYNKLL